LAFKSVYGKSLDTLWRDYEAAEAASVPAATSDRATRLTTHRYVVSGPRFVRTSGRADIYYSVEDADRLPGLYRVPASGAAARPERVTTRFSGSTLGGGHGRIYFDQQELRRNAGVYSDLYSLDPL